MDNRVEIRPGRTVNIVTYPHSSSNITLFLIHGLGGSGKQWREQIPLLKKDYNLVVPDMLGHGKSDKPRGVDNNLYAFTELESDLQAIFNRYSSEKNIILGHSYGGALAASLVCNNQGNVDKFVVLAPTPCGPGFVIPFLFKLPVFLMEWLRPVLEKQFIELAFLPSDNPELIKSELLASRENPMYMVKAMIAGMQKMPVLDVKQINIPALILLGKNDRLVPNALSAAFYQALPKHQIVTLENASHMLMLEKPAETNEAINKFLS